jgi:hypothetical protein
MPSSTTVLPAVSAMVMSSRPSIPGLPAKLNRSTPSSKSKARSIPNPSGRTKTSAPAPPRRISVPP